jgi:phage-related protein
LPQTEVFFFREPKNRSVPLLGWLDRLPTKVKAKCTERIDRLGELGHELHRPEADFLRDGIYALRASYQGIHYRMIYFFAGRAIVVVSHGLTKERQVPQKEIDQAIERKHKVSADFQKFTFKPE